MSFEPFTLVKAAVRPSVWQPEDLHRRFQRQEMGAVAPSIRGADVSLFHKLAYTACLVLWEAKLVLRVEKGSDVK